MATAQRVGFTDVHVVQHAAVGAPQSHDVHEVAQAAFTGQSLAEKGGPLRSLAADTRVAFHRVHRSEPAQHVDETAAQLGRAGEAPRETLLSGRLTRAPELRRRLVDVLSRFAPVHAVEGYASVCSEAAQGAALLGQGLAGEGGLSDLVDTMGLRSAGGGVLDHVYVSEADSLRRRHPLPRRPQAPFW